MGKVIVVASGKGGTGKTTAVGAIGSCLAAMGNSTLCVDCDSGLRNLDITLGMTGFAASDLSRVVDGECTLHEAIIKHPDIENLSFMDAPPFYRVEYDLRKAKDVFAEIRETFDFCLLDAPAGIGPDVMFTASLADMAIIVATGDASSIRDGQVMSVKLREAGIEDVRLLVNRVRGRMFSATGSTVDNMIDAIGARLIGVIKEDREVTLSANLETPLVLYSRKSAAKGFLKVAQRIAGVDVPISVR
ncbi:MAG: AAA family ATPase [Oscillospiraceae bacterium]|nr:AAA family ATPase [Oscillospiraceae bacterium]